MSVRTARILAGVFLALFLLAVTWPGMIPFNRIHPLVLGLPFSMAWVAGWVAAGCGVLWMVHRVEAREREAERSDRRGRLDR